MHDNCKQATGMICTKQFNPWYCCLPQSCTVYGHPLEQKVTYFNQSSETQEQLMAKGTEVETVGKENGIQRVFCAESRGSIQRAV